MKVRPDRDVQVCVDLACLKVSAQMLADMFH